MPLYEYVCQDCEQKFEKLVRLDASNGNVACPFCGSCDVKRAISLFSTGSGGAWEARDRAASCAPTGG